MPQYFGRDTWASKLFQDAMCEAFAAASLPSMSLGTASQSAKTLGEGAVKPTFCMFITWLGPKRDHTHIHIHICKYIHIYVSTYLDMYIYTYRHIYKSKYIHTYLQMYICTFIQIYTNIDIYIYIYMIKCMYVSMYVSMYVCMYVCIYILVCMYMNCHESVLLVINVISRR